ncbi:MAG: glycosyltransferase [Muribaculaceae bacterium]|nr:glycosyltransferase [Muribaculaceae bacterium]
MRVASINTVATQNNAPGRIMLNISDAILRTGGESLVTYGRGESSIPNSYKISSTCNAIIHTLKSRISDSEGLHSINATKKLIAQLESFNPDIIHLHNIHGHYVNYPLLMRWLKDSDIPVVWTMHDCWAITGHCCHYSANGCDKWKNGCRDCKYSYTYPRSISSQSKRNFELKRELFSSLPNLTIVAVSNWLANELKQSYLNKYPIEVIHNGIDSEIFKAMPHPSNGKFRILGVASHWGENKNIEFFNHLANKISPNEEIIIVGDITLKKRLQLHKNTTHIGKFRSAKKLAEIYSSADVFINPSREETFGMTTIEAMACGTPVIVNNATALPETITSNSGIVVDIDNISKVYNVITHIKEHRQNFTTGRKHIIDNYSINQMTSQYLNLYQNKMKKEKGKMITE